MVIVTGAGRGLGREHALAFGRHGARVVVNDVGDGIVAVAGEVQAAGGSAVASSGDVSDWAYAESLVAKAVAEFGTLDALVNNAGVNRDARWSRCPRKNGTACCGSTSQGTSRRFGTRAAGYWRERAKEGQPVATPRIVNTSSGAG